MLRHLRLSAQAAPLFLVAMFTIGLLLAARLKLMGIPLALILVSWFFKYCFVLLDAAVAGNREAPVLSLEMLNPLDEQRPLALLVLVAAAVAAMIWLRGIAGSPALLASGALFITVLPAIVAVFAMSHNPLHALAPRALFNFIRGIGPDYLWLILALIGATYGIYLLWSAPVPPVVPIALSQLVLLALFTLLGALVHEHRHMLGVETRSPEERAHERASAQYASERQRVLDDAHVQVRLRRISSAWNAIEQWLSVYARGDQAWKEYAALLEAASAWEDPRIADRLADDYLARLLARRENGLALEVLAQRLASHPGYRPARPEHARRLAELAQLAGKPALQRRLIAPPDSPPAS